MIEFIQTVLALIVTISILVTIHEYGHYIVARWCNVHVIRFCIGFGSLLYVRRGPAPEPAPETVLDERGEPVPIRTRSNEPLAGTEFAIAALPLGGYVKMLDEREGFVPDDQLHLAFNRKSVWQRIAIVSAGPLANFILAVVAYWLLFATGVTGIAPILGQIEPDSAAGQAGLRAGQEIVAIDDSATRTWTDVNMRLFKRLGESGEILLVARQGGEYGAVSEHRIEVKEWLSDKDEPSPTRDLGLSLFSPDFPAIIGGLNADGRAAAAGMQVADEVIAFNGATVRDWSHLVSLIQAQPESQVSLTVLRNGMTEQLLVTPAAVDRDGRQIGFIGAAVEPVNFPDHMLREVTYPFYLAWLPALEKTWEVTAFTVESIGKMIQGAISPKNLSGPITIAQVANATAENGLESFIGFIALLSISLGVINLLPIPVLDGGHLLYYLIELVAGKPVPERVQVWGLQVGMFLIMSIMILAFYNDLTRL